MSAVSEESDELENEAHAVSERWVPEAQTA
jgi:hypothetical protein